ncbi:choice-of-anchor D domain-containing protein [Flavobacterium sp. WG47]|nr:choice-of-anchor D domain-containing protein [Flavobacterium sp. WG47]
MGTCTSYGATNITTGSSATYQSSVLWTSSGTGSFANATSLTTCTYTPSAADITAGSVTLTLTAYGNAPCGNTTSTKTLTITTTPTVTGTTPGSRTGAGTVLLGATVSGGTPTWYAAATGGTALGTGTSFTTPVISATTTFYVEAANGSCASSPRTAVIATVNYTEIDIQGNATSIVSGDITPSASDWTDFGTTNPTRTFTIRNMGMSLLTVGAITISGANASEFTVTTAPSATVAIGSSTTFVVTFAPTAVGVRTANISIVNNDGDENPYTFDVQGTGVLQEMDIQGNATSIVDGDMSPTTGDWTDFSTVAGTRTFTIRNLGNIALTVGTITIGGTNASDFSVTTAPAATVGAYGTTTFVVTFAPTAINTRTASISIVNNDTNENPYDFGIQGFGIIPEIDIQGNATSITDSTVPAPTTANWTDFGSTNGTRTFTIYNTGNITLTVGAITFTGTNASEFTVTTPPAASIAAFSSTTFVVTFLPTATGTRSAVIHIVNNDSTENPYDFNIQGTGVPREIDVQGLGLSIASADMVTSVNDGTDFGSADINLATITRTFTIRNTGTLALTISNPTITGANSGDFSITANPGTLSIGAGASTTFQVTFNPSAVFTRIAQINIVNNDSDENPYYFGIQGTGLLDNDGDGIENNTDQDDDNDGVIDTIECGTCISDPFVNGGFEAPVIGTATYSIEPAANVTGWNNSAENFIEIWSTGFNGVPSAAGNQFAELNANVAGNLYQTFCLNGAGGTINWAIKHRGRSGTDTAQVRFGPDLASLTTVATMTDGNTAWGSYSGTYTIPAGQTTIVLAFTAVSSTGGLSYGNFIDDVQIIINQNCIDTDSDGVADILDVDDDNDGIPDIEEAGFKQYSNNTGTMDKTNPANWKDLNGNGINDYIDTMISGGTYLIPDSDGDGVYNHLDLDSDNDTLWDVDEANLLNGDGDINDDGKGDGADSEGDGLLNLFDNSTVFGSAYRAYAQDSDSNGISDYLQLDSNDDGTNDIQTSLYGSYDTNGDGRIDGTGDTDLDGIPNVFDTNDALRGSPRDLDRKLFLEFDGRNDYAEDSPVLGGLSNATLMAWIDLNSAYSSTGVVVGQDRFHIRVTGSKILQAVVNGTILSYGTPLNTSQWCHVAATYAGGTLTLYLNGKSVANVALSGAISADTSNLTLGKNPLTATSYFKGKIDEVRVFNVALTAVQVERMVYQEIQNNSSQVRGAIVPKDVGSLPWTNLVKYYRMDTYKDDIVDNLTTGTVDTGTGMKLYNHKVINVQQAPMPFTTVRTGSFSSAVNDATKDIRGLDVLDFDYSIIQVNHDITETANSTDLALFVNSGVTVNMTNDTKLQNDWYLLLNGKIDLAGKSQLIQTTNSDLDVTSAGSLERDQQGQSNKFNYNYWSSPVSSINNTTINHGFTVAGVMKDGTTATPQSLQWTTGINGSPTTPLTLSSYWIFKFQNSTNSYANWASVGQNGALTPGQGFTLKGGGAATSNQNYTFVGKPNSGIITSTVGANNLNLCGNPYPSAIDANQFIDDNASSIKGTLYIWEHYITNTSHNTIAYQGGYATYTKTGGTSPVAPAGVSGLGSSSKVAKRFIPVGQGFFVTGSATGGTITFNNGQRLFVKEDDAVNSYSLYKAPNSTVAVETNPLMNNAQDEVTEEEFMKLRVGYNSTDNYHRQTLLGFMNEHATSGYDNGYDGVSIEALTNDMYFINGTDKLNINGDGFFNVNNIYPLGVKNATSGNVTFVVDNKENFDDDQEIYIFDNVTNTYNSIKSQNYQVNLPAGTYEDRFSLRFTNGTSLGTSDNENNHGITVTHSQSNNMINIKNALQEVTVKSVALFNLLGQQVTEWKVENQDQANIQLQVSDVSTGTYIVKVLTDGGKITKKILVKK